MMCSIHVGLIKVDGGNGNPVGFNICVVPPKRRRFGSNTPIQERPVRHPFLPCFE